MAKRKKKAEEAAVEESTTNRLMAIREFNMQNAGKLWIDPDRVPTEEEINEAKTAFETCTSGLRDKKDYLIADKYNALRVAKFLKNFIENGFWTQRFFVGVINFTEYIDGVIKELEEDSEKDFVMEYGPMQFCQLMLENYGGIGLESAKKMAEMYNEYVPIYDTFKDHTEWYNEEVKKCELYKQRWGMLAQGYYLVILEDEPETTEPDVAAPAVDETSEETAN